MWNPAVHAVYGICPRPPKGKTWAIARSFEDVANGHEICASILFVDAQGDNVIYATIGSPSPCIHRTSLDRTNCETRCAHAAARGYLRAGRTALCAGRSGHRWLRSSLSSGHHRYHTISRTVRGTTSAPPNSRCSGAQSHAPYRQGSCSRSPPISRSAS